MPSMVAWVAFGAAVLALPTWAEEIVSWTDASGRLHFTNTPSYLPTDDGRSERVMTAPIEPGGDAEAEPGARPLPEPGVAAAEADAAAAASPDFSTQASLRRTALARDLRATEKQIRAIDERMETLARARAKNVRGSVSTGGVGANPDVQSEEERDLAEQRAALVEHSGKVRTEGATLRGEVSTRLGSTPAWWTDVR